MNLECRSEMCCTRLAANAGPKIAKNSPSGNNCTTLSGYIFASKACIDNNWNNLLISNVSPTWSHKVTIWLTSAHERLRTCWRVWGNPANFNGFHVLAALLHGTVLVGVSQILRRWAEAPPIFGKTAITLGIGPHSSWFSFSFFSTTSRNLIGWKERTWS